MAAKNKVIITCAVTGSIHTPSMSPYLPVTAEQIAENAIGAAQAKLSRASRMLFMGNHSSSVPGGMCPGVGLSLR